MEQTAQLGLRANTWVRLPLPRSFVEDTISLSDAQVRVQFKKSMGTMKRKCVLWSSQKLNHRVIGGSNQGRAIGARASKNKGPLSRRPTHCL